MELFFETYLIVALIFAIITICFARLYLKNKKFTFGFSALVIVLGAVIPYFLILFQKAYGSVGEIDWLKFTDGRTPEEMAEYLRRTSFISFRPNYEVAFDYFTHNLVSIILSISIGILLGILTHLLLRKQK